MRKLAGVLLLGVVGAYAADASSTGIRDAATKAVALLQSSQKDWYSKQSCASCHHQALPAMAYRVAREHGVAVDETLAHADAAQAFGSYANLDRAVQYTHIIDPVMDDGFRLLAANAAGVRPSLTTAIYARFVAQHQLPDGHWTTIDERPPQSASFVTATAVALRAIQLHGHASLASDTASRIARARTWLAAQHARNTEERTMQLLGLNWAGASRSDLAKLAGELAASQQKDGGWNSLNGRSSDAYSTGEALMALHSAAGMAVNDPVWTRGLRFLLDTQQADGSWHVVSRLHPPANVSPPYFETGYPYGHDQFISAMGASWAIMALATALPSAARYEAKPLHEAEPKDVEPWAETVLFGRASELRALLDKKLDPNSATKGGTTALMMAMPDLEKAKLLLDHGANINARSKTRYSALLVAAQYPGSTAVMRMLLDRGAEVRSKKGEGAPLFNATALGLSILSGNRDLIREFVSKGDKPDDKYTFLGLFPGTTLTFPPSADDTATVTALLEAGVPVDFADSENDDLTLLGSAVLANRVNVARLLISHGAKVDAVDKKGMTPLLYAASIDFGDSQMIDLLLKSGANKQAKTKEGLTALDLARKYNHTHLMSSLAR